MSINALLPGAVIQLERWGLLARLRAARTPAVRTVVVNLGDDRRSLDLHEPLYAPRRFVLDPVLVAAARFAGARVRYGITVDSLQSDRHGRVTGVAGRGRDGGPFRATARMVVGADGRHSRVARLAGAATTRRGTASGAIAYRHVAGLPTDGYELVYRRGVAAGLIPTNDGLTCVWVGAPSARFPAGGTGGLGTWFHSILEQASPHLAQRLSQRPTGPPAGFAGTPSRLREPWGSGWALVGDAGAFTDAVGAHGLTAALRDAELAADAVIGILRDAADENAAMNSYRTERNRLTLPVMRATDALASYLWDEGQIAEHLDSLSTALKVEASYLLDRWRASSDREARGTGPRTDDPLNRARSTTELAALIIEAENGARLAELARAHGDRRRADAALRREHVSASASSTAASARQLFHALIDDEYEHLCAVEDGAC